MIADGDLKTDHAGIWTYNLHLSLPLPYLLIHLGFHELLCVRKPIYDSLEPWNKPHTQPSMNDRECTFSNVIKHK